MSAINFVFKAYRFSVYLDWFRGLKGGCRRIGAVSGLADALRADTPAEINRLSSGWEKTVFQAR